MMPFDLVEATSLAEAIEALDPDDPSVRPLSGGTALMLMMKSGLFRPTRLVSLQRLGGDLTRIDEMVDGGLAIGGLASLTEIESSPLVTRKFPVIVAALRRLGNIRVRNVARLGGCLAHGDPHMDLPPLLTALGASVRVVGPVGERTVALPDLYLGYYETTLARNELITEVQLPQPGAATAAYLKCTTRSADDWPAVGVAVRLTRSGSRIDEARIVVGAATDRPRRLTGAENILRGVEPDDPVVRRVGEAAASEIVCIDDALGSADYKQQLVRVYVGRAIRTALHQGAIQ